MSKLRFSQVLSILLFKTRTLFNRIFFPLHNSAFLQSLIYLLLHCQPAESSAALTPYTFNFVGLTVAGPVQDPLTVLLLNNQLYMKILIIILNIFSRGWLFQILLKSMELDG